MRRWRGVRCEAIWLALAAIAGVWAAGSARGEPDCAGGEIEGFGALAERIGEIDDLDGAQVLSAELLVSPVRDCREVWLVEVLTGEDEVIALLFDARTLEPRRVGQIGDGDGDEADDDGEEDYFAIYSEITGGETADFLEGFWSDDTLTGGPGPDLFVVTPGTDVITDFDPAEDLLDLGDFARREEGFGLLRSIDDLARMSRRGIEMRRPALVIDTDGEAGDWSTALLGVAPGALTRENVIFGMRGREARRVELTHLPERAITVSDESVVVFPARPIDGPRVVGRLLEGRAEALEAMAEILGEAAPERGDE